MRGKIYNTADTKESDNGNAMQSFELQKVEFVSSYQVRLKRN